MNKCLYDLKINLSVFVCMTAVFFGAFTDYVFAKQQTKESVKTEEKQSDEKQEFTQRYIDEKREELKIQFPQDKYWNHKGGLFHNVELEDSVTKIPCDHTKEAPVYCNFYLGAIAYGYQCAGFAAKISNEIFGKRPCQFLYRYCPCEKRGLYTI